MKLAGLDRWAPLSGIIFFLLTVPTLFLPPKAPPSAEDPAAKWAAFVQDHRSAYLVSMCLSGLAVCAFLAFLATLVTRLRAADQELLAVVALGGGLVTAAVWYVWLSFEGVLAWTSPSGIDPTVVKTLLAAADFAFPFPIAVLAAATSFAALRSALWPAWLSYIGLVGAVWVLVGGMAMARNGFFAPTSGARLTGWAFFFLWVLVVSVFLLRKAQQVRTFGVASPATTPAR
jgi:hypothetical protein